MDMFHYAMHKVLYEDFAAAYSPAVKLEAVLWFNQHRNRIRKLSLRGMEDALNFIARADDEISKQKALGLLLHRTDVRTIPGFSDDEIIEALALKLAASK